MAKARANCTCSTCGREFEAEKICHNRRDADSWESWAEQNIDECPDCREARIQRERDEANAAAKAAAEEAGFPELTGTEKQVAWATTIRQAAFGSMGQAIQKDEVRLQQYTEKASAEKVRQISEMLGKARRFMDWLFSEKTTAHWWIDHRDMAQADPVMIFRAFLHNVNGIREEFEAADARAQAETNDAPLREAAQQETTVQPENPAHEGRVEVTVSEDAVSARYPKNDDFRAVVKPLGFTWDKTSGAWVKKITVTTGSAQERAAELGNKLLNAGFAVCIADPETRQAAIEGRYEPEHQRWIVARDGKFVIKLRYGDGMYEKARAITGARYSKPDITVPASEWAAVEDFAGLYDYRLSPGAQELLNRKKGVTIIVAPAPAREAVYAEHDPAEILSTSADVLDDLKED